MKNQSVAVNPFVRRQVKGSGKSFAVDLSFETMAHLAEKRLNLPGNHIFPGYRDGVCLVRAEKKYNSHFFSPLIKINDSTPLIAHVVKRRSGEEPYIQIRATKGSPAIAFHVDFILYRHVVLSETNEHSSDANWDLISINALPKGFNSMPMGPVTMMRNQLELPGGTRASYSSKEWAVSVSFWQKYAFLDC